MKDAIDWAVEKTKGVVRREDTVRREDQKKIPVRCPSSSGYKRQILNIPVEEIAQGICYLLRDSFSLNENETVLYAGKIPVSGKSKEHFINALQLLSDKKYIINERNRFTLTDRNNCNCVF